MKLRVKIKRVKDVEMPKYAKPGDSGFDLVAAEDTIIWPGETKVVPTGLAFEIPPGYELQVRPRSGMTRNTKLRVVLGTVDSGYRGEVGVLVDNNERPISLNMKAHVIEKGTRIAQGVIAPVVTAHFVEVDELSDSERGKGGFGSTGVK
ncbi:dUTP diphosphatase [Bacillus cereus]|uniref:dUTP diphosphatase n=1 Tax=Bacillus cereus TaxID=1396 RepID=UPI000BEDB38E|nr:dUTP diphosphatase [Bacillus cereus]PDY70808.1 dUTP diphosphatase [Bacillus cereus]PET45466.1 dUTP diphosphatase [Bacillus cereus]PGK22749.1 dUTP diphosphatase [Bacillus cereus]PGQ24559.1 dUTP diphosphatase [Bacillus cereus]PGW89948.1 dUTP diphosphatase [Bacillus cereus]